MAHDDLPLLEPLVAAYERANLARADVSEAELEWRDAVRWDLGPAMEPAARGGSPAPDAVPSIATILA